MININNYILPIIVILIILYGYFNKLNVYESFLNGCKDGFKIMIDISPTVITMVFVINIFIKSNFINYVIKSVHIISPEVISMMVLRPVSGNATLGILQEVFLKYGPDSFNGFIASLIQGSTETTIYVIALYFGSIGVKKIGHTLKIGLIVDFIGIILAILFAFLLFK